MLTHHNTAQKKLYSVNAIGIATFFGSPLAAGILARHNYLVLGKEDKAKNALLLAVAVTVLLFLSIFLIPEPIMNKVPNAVFPMIYTLVIKYLVEKLQGEDIEKHEAEGKEFASTWKAVGIGIICGVIVIGSLFGLAFLEPVDPTYELYEQKMVKFVANEEIALEIYDNTITNDYLLVQKIKNQAIPKWEDNLRIVQTINEIENLPGELQERNKYIEEYCELRIEAAKLIEKMLLENTDTYLPQLNQIDFQIEQLIKNELQ